jgi:hypothetical protein
MADIKKGLLREREGERESRTEKKSWALLL